MSRNTIGIIDKYVHMATIPVVRELVGMDLNVILFLENQIQFANRLFRRGRCVQNIIRIDNRDTIKNTIHKLKKNKVTHIVCINEDLKNLLIENLQLLDGFKYAFPEKNHFKIGLQKDMSIPFVRNLGIPTPKLIEYDKIENFDLNNIRMPLVIKGFRGASSTNVRYAYNHSELEEYINEIQTNTLEYNNGIVKPLVQEYIGGPTYLTQTLTQHGDVKIVVPHNKIREWPLTGGVSTRAVTIDEPRLVEYSTKILERLHWHGEAGFEWKYDDERDDFYFIEMNPRFEGSIGIAVKAGVNIPSLLIDIIDGKRISDNLKYKSNVHFRWIFRDDFNCFLNAQYSLIKLIKESLDPKIHGEYTFEEFLKNPKILFNPLHDIIQFLKER